MKIHAATLSTFMLACGPVGASMNEATPASTPMETPAVEAAMPGSSSVNPAIPNFRQVREKLVTGGQPEPAAWPHLASQGVRVVINLRPQEEMNGRDEAAEVARRW